MDYKTLLNKSKFNKVESGDRTTVQIEHTTLNRSFAIKNNNLYEIRYRGMNLFATESR